MDLAGLSETAILRLAIGVAVVVLMVVIWLTGRKKPDQVVRRIGSELLPHLAWPEDTSDASAWHAAWGRAFVLRHGAQISSAARLAERMAHAAQILRVEIAQALEAERGAGPFSDLLEEIRSQLIGDATPATFADMCAQTLVYGLLASRVTDPARSSPCLPVHGMRGRLISRDIP